MKIQGGGFQACEAINFTSARIARQSAAERAAEEGGQATAENSGVDFSSMSRAEMKKVAQHWWEEGEIDLTQLGMIQMAGPLGKAGPNGEFIPFTEAERAQLDGMPIDYPRLIEGAMAFIEGRHAESDPKSGYANWKHILSILEGPQTALPRVDVRA